MIVLSNNARLKHRSEHEPALKDAQSHTVMGNSGEMAVGDTNVPSTPTRFFLPKSLKSSERRFSPSTLDETCVVFKVTAPQRRRTEGSGALFVRSDRRNVKSAARTTLKRCLAVFNTFGHLGRQEFVVYVVPFTLALGLVRL